MFPVSANLDYSNSLIVRIGINGEVRFHAQVHRRQDLNSTFAFSFRRWWSS
jgi:hypothetical protein